MGTKYTFLDLAQDVLKEAKKPLGCKQICEIAKEKGLDKKTGSTGKTPWATLRNALDKNVKKENSIFYIASKRPTTYCLKEYKKDIKNLSNIEESKKETLKDKKNYNERDLHTILVKYLNEDSQFNLYCKTIYHEKSAKNEKGKNKWNFPDIVGVHFPFNDSYKEEMTLTLLNVLQLSRCKFYSFELKKELNSSNLKECYFQAVSNSSWANEGYLVVFKIDDKIIDELKRLNASFGIGVIWLQTGGIKVILSAKNKEIDITTLDKLINENKDFKSFIKSVLEDMAINDKKRIVKDSYDEILEDGALQKYLKDKEIDKKIIDEDNNE